MGHAFCKFGQKVGVCRAGLPSGLAMIELDRVDCSQGFQLVDLFVLLPMPQPCVGQNIKDGRVSFLPPRPGLH